MAAPAASAKTFWNLQVECPHCELRGTIPWDRLSPKKRVRCVRCGKWFGIDAQGSASKAEAPDAAITIAVRGALSEWKEHLAPESGRLERPAPRGWERLRGRRTRIAVAVALCAVVALGWRMVSGGTSLEPAETAYQEPESLADRAAAFSLAWACNDTPTMTRFTAPGQTKPFVAWRTRSQLSQEFDDAQPAEIKAETISVTPQKELNSAIVTVGLTLRAAPPTKDAGGNTHREIWTEVDGKWFFAPEETIKASVPAAAPEVPQWR